MITEEVLGHRQGRERPPYQHLPEAGTTSRDDQEHISPSAWPLNRLPPRGTPPFAPQAKTTHISPHAFFLVVPLIPQTHNRPTHLDMDDAQFTKGFLRNLTPRSQE